MVTLSNLRNTHRPTKNVQRVGRGNGSKRGKTCCRGHKGDKSRSGYKRRYGQEGGQLPLYKKIPTRGFSNARFKSKVFAINLSEIQDNFNDGELVSIETLIEKRIATHAFTGGLKILSMGELTKKVEIEANSISKAAVEKLNASKVSYKILTT